jgi:hypothetical protein
MSQQEVTRLHAGRAHLDEEVGEGIAIDIAHDETVCTGEAGEAELAGHAGEVAANDEREGLVPGGEGIGIDAPIGSRECYADFAHAKARRESSGRPETGSA